MGLAMLGFFTRPPNEDFHLRLVTCPSHEKGLLETQTYSKMLKTLKRAKKSKGLWKD